MMDIATRDPTKKISHIYSICVCARIFIGVSWHFWYFHTEFIRMDIYHLPLPIIQPTKKRQQKSEFAYVGVKTLNPKP